MTSKLLVDSIEGRTGKGFLTPDRPSFRAVMTADQSANFTTETNIAFNSVSASDNGHDNAGGFDTSTNKYTIQTTGMYFICINLRGSSLTDAAYHTIKLKKNGSEVQYARALEDPQGGNQAQLHVTAILPFSAGDVIHWTYLVSGDTSSQLDQATTSFEGFLIG
jgi:hypothetical protein